MAGFWWEPSSCLADSHLLTVSSHDEERAHKLSDVSSYKDTNPIGLGSYLTLVTSTKALSPNTVIWRVRASNYDLEGGRDWDTNIGLQCLPRKT